MNVIGLDPGSKKSAWVLYDGGEPVRWGYDMNSFVRVLLANSATNFPPGPVLLAVEYMRPRGLPTSQDEMDTMFELGRMVQTWNGEWKPVSRHEVKLHVCGHAKAKDANIRAALIDRFGGSSALLGTPKCPTCKGKGDVTCPTCRGRRLLKGGVPCSCSQGLLVPAGVPGRVECPTCRGLGHPRGSTAGVLHGLSGDAWSALAVAVTAAETVAKRGSRLIGEKS